MSNKTSDENVANIEDFIKVYKEMKMQKNVIENIDKDYFTEFVDKLIKKLDEKDKRIKELEEELAEFNKQLDLDYVDENFIPRQVLKDEIDVHTNLIIAETGNPTLDAHFRDRENYVIDVLQKILKKGEK